MKKAIVFLLILSVGFLSSMTFSTTLSKKIEPKTENEILELVLNMLKSRHIEPKKLDDNFSKKFFNTYLDSLDRRKIFLLKSDIDEFKKYETKLDDQLKENDLTFFFMTYDRIMLRMKEGKEMYTNTIKNKLDFTTNEETKFYQDKNTGKIAVTTFAQSKSEQAVRWNNLLKTIVFKEIRTTFESNFSQITPENILILAQSIDKMMDASNFNVTNTSREEIFEDYINSILMQYDPHSKYYIPKNRDKYLNNETGKIEGVGISLILVNEFVQIRKLTEGGPAWKTKKCNIGDVILKVGEENEYPTNVAGFNIYEVTQLLKGKSGTNIKITVKKPNGKIQEIPIKRGIVAMNDSYIKSCLIKKNKSSYGVLSFPRFYNDFDDNKARNATSDFTSELENLKLEGAKGLILDLRDNEGGSVEAAVKIIGNFITKSPVIQLRTKDEKVLPLETENLKKTWDKNVVVIVNAKTASAAEIIATAFQEFNIGVVVGEQTFGKGTIQDFQDLNVFKPTKIGNKDLGAIKISSQKFYKLNGKSNQKNGIIPDVEFSKNQLLERETNTYNALLPDEVKPVKCNSVNEANFFSSIIQNSKNRCLQDQNFIRAQNSIANEVNISESIANLKTLNVSTFIKQISDILAKNKTTPKPEFDKTITFVLTTEGQKELKSKDYLVQKRNIWLEELKNDYQIKESITILDEMRFLK